ncbi:hypothetical protein GGI05_006131 [Coemansia sp. RSA 2603]|nr:hypothetical protein GGI05_006131 [Coemansia sp. RSA 2603]
MLSFNPGSRISAADALKHPYFTNLPRPTKPAKLPRPKKEEEAVDVDSASGGRKRQLLDAFSEDGDVFGGKAIDGPSASKRMDMRISSPA